MNTKELAFAGSPGSRGDARLGICQNGKSGEQDGYFPHGHPKVQVEPVHWPDVPQGQSQLQVILFSLVELAEAENAAAVFSDREAPFDPLRVPPAALVRVDRFLVVGEDGIEGGLDTRFDAVVDPFVPAGRGEDSGLAERLQMGGERRLAYFHRIGELADAELVPEQGGENADASGIGEGLAKEGDIIHGFTSGNDDMIPRFPMQGSLTSSG